MVQIMASTFRYLSFLGIWPNDKSKFVRKVFVCKFITLILISSFLLWGGVLHFIMQRSNEDNKNVVEDLVTIISEFFFMYYNVIFAIFYENIAQIINKLGDVKVFGKPKNFDRHNRQINFISSCFREMVVVFTLCFVLYSVLSTKDCENSNKAKQVKDVCGMVAPIWLPNSIVLFPFKQVVIIWQALCALINFTSAAAITCAILGIEENLILRIQHLKQMIPTIVEVFESQLRSELFAKWVRYHVFINDLAKLIDSTFSYGLMTHATGTAVVLGLAGYSVMTNTATCSVLLLFFGWFVALLLVCISGQRLKNEAESVGASIYHSLWYLTPPSFQKQLFYAILQSQKPIEIHAGPFTYLSHNLIVTVLKGAFSYINLLQAKSEMQN